MNPICLTREEVFGFEAQVYLGGVSLEMDPELRGEDHNWDVGGGLPTELGQQLPIPVT